MLAKRAAKLADLREVRDRAAAVQRQLDARAADAEAVAQRRQEVVAELDTLVAPDNPFREALSKIFFRWVRSARACGGGQLGAASCGGEQASCGSCSEPGVALPGFKPAPACVPGLTGLGPGRWCAPRRKIKRAPKRGHDDDDDDDSLSDDDYDDNEDEGDGDSDEEGPEVCPPGCDQVGGPRPPEPRWLRRRPCSRLKLLRSLPGACARINAAPGLPARSRRRLCARLPAWPAS